MEVEEIFGFLQFFRKNGELGSPYPLSYGKTTIGSSVEADIRLKMNDSRLEQIHCVINVYSDGLATLVNKSRNAPVKVNDIPIPQFKVLNHMDKFEIVGKLFQYVNEYINKKDVAKLEKNITNAISPKKTRHSEFPMLNVNSATPPNIRTKTPVKRRLTNRSSVDITQSSGLDFVMTVTPEAKPDTQNVTSKSQTTSKVIVSKALSTSSSQKKRRLSLGNSTKVSSTSPKISSRNILLSTENVLAPGKSIMDASFNDDTLKTPLKCKSVSIKDCVDDEKTPVRATVSRNDRSSIKKSLLKRHSSTPKISSPKKKTPTPVPDKLNKTTPNSKYVTPNSRTLSPIQHLSTKSVNSTKNDVSVVYVDTSTETPTGDKRSLSKTLNSSSVIEILDTTTPKSVIKGRKSNNVTPDNKVSNMGGFKTPLNTPQLFESIRKSAIKSRLQTSTADLNFEKKCSKRARESTGSVRRTNKKLKFQPNLSDEDASDENDTVQPESLPKNALSRESAADDPLELQHTFDDSSLDISESSHISRALDNSTTPVESQIPSRSRRRSRYSLTNQALSSHAPAKSPPSTPNISQATTSLESQSQASRRSSRNSSINKSVKSVVDEFVKSSQTDRNLSVSIESQNVEDFNTSDSEMVDISQSVSSSNIPQAGRKSSFLNSSNSRKSTRRSDVDILTALDDPETSESPNLSQSRRSNGYSLTNKSQSFIADESAKSCQNDGKTPQTDRRSFISNISQSGKKSNLDSSKSRKSTRRSDVDILTALNDPETPESPNLSQSRRSNRYSLTNKSQSFIADESAKSCQIDGKTPQTDRRSFISNISQSGKKSNLLDSSKSSKSTRRSDVDILTALDNPETPESPNLSQSRRSNRYSLTNKSQSFIADESAKSCQNDGKTPQTDRRSFISNISQSGKKSNLDSSKSRKSTRRSDVDILTALNDPETPESPNLSQSRRSNRYSLTNKSQSFIADESAKSCQNDGKTPQTDRRSFISNISQSGKKSNLDSSKSRKSTRRSDVDILTALNDPETPESPNLSQSRRSNRYSLTNKSQSFIADESAKSCQIDGKTPQTDRRSFISNISQSGKKSNLLDSSKSRKSTRRSDVDILTALDDPETPESLNLSQSRRSNRYSLTNKSQASILDESVKSPQNDGKTSQTDRKSSVSSLKSRNSLRQSDSQNNKNLNTSDSDISQSISTPNIPQAGRKSSLLDSSNSRKSSRIYDIEPLTALDDPETPESPNFSQSRRSNRYSQASILDESVKSPQNDGKTSQTDRKSSVSSLKLRNSLRHSESQNNKNLNTSDSDISQSISTPNIPQAGRKSSLLDSSNSRKSSRLSDIEPLTALDDPETPESPNLSQSRRSNRYSLTNKSKSFIADESAKSCQNDEKTPQTDRRSFISNISQSGKKSNLLDSSKSRKSTRRYDVEILTALDNPETPESPNLSQSRRSNRYSLTNKSQASMLDESVKSPQNDGKTSQTERKSSVSSLKLRNSLRQSDSQNIKNFNTSDSDISQSISTPDIPEAGRKSSLLDSSNSRKSSRIYDIEPLTALDDPETPESLNLSQSRRSNRYSQASILDESVKSPQNDEKTSQTDRKSSVSSLKLRNSLRQNIKNLNTSDSDVSQSISSTPNIPQAVRKSSRRSDIEMLTAVDDCQSEDLSQSRRSSRYSLTNKSQLFVVDKTTKSPLNDEKTAETDENLISSGLKAKLNVSFKDLNALDLESESINSPNILQTSRKSSLLDSSKLGKSYLSDIDDSISQNIPQHRRSGRYSLTNKSQSFIADESAKSSQNNGKTPQTDRRSFISNISQSGKKSNLLDSSKSRKSTRRSDVDILTALDDPETPESPNLSQSRRSNRYSLINKSQASILSPHNDGKTSQTDRKSSVSSLKLKNSLRQSESPNIKKLNTSDSDISQSISTPDIPEVGRKSNLLDSSNSRKSSRLSDIEPLTALGDPETLESPNLSQSRRSNRYSLTNKSQSSILDESVKSPQNFVKTPQINRKSQNTEDLNAPDSVGKKWEPQAASSLEEFDALDSVIISEVDKSMNTPNVSQTRKSIRLSGFYNSLESESQISRPMRKLHQTPKVVKSPKNDLTNVYGVKRLLRTPKLPKSPKNDLTDVRGVRALLGSAKINKSPKNDLTAVPSLRRFLSPKLERSPKNDLSEVHGLKKLLRTPKKQKEPLNDLGDVDGVDRLFTIQQLKEDINKLNLSGVQILSDVETNDELFDKVASTKKLRTYPGRSLSPKKSLDMKETDRVNSPVNKEYLEQWVNHQQDVQNSRVLKEMDDNIFGPIVPLEKKFVEEMNNENAENISPIKRTRGKKLLSDIDITEPFNDKPILSEEKRVLRLRTRRNDTPVKKIEVTFKDTPELIKTNSKKPTKSKAALVRDVSKEIKETSKRTRSRNKNEGTLDTEIDTTNNEQVELNPSPKKIRANRNKQVEGSKQNMQAEYEENNDEAKGIDKISGIKKAATSKRTRRGVGIKMDKAVDIEINTNNNEQMELTPSPKKIRANRNKQVDGSKQNKQVEYEENNDEAKGIDKISEIKKAATSKRTRRGMGIKMDKPVDIEINTNNNEQMELTPSPKKLRTKRKKPVDNTKQKKSNEVKDINKISEIDVPITKRTRRGMRSDKDDTVATEKNTTSNEQIELNPSPKKLRTNRKKQIDDTKQENINEAKDIDKILETTSKRARRGMINKNDDSTDVEVNKTSNGTPIQPIRRSKRTRK